MTTATVHMKQTLLHRNIVLHRLLGTVGHSVIRFQRERKTAMPNLRHFFINRQRHRLCEPVQIICCCKLFEFSSKKLTLCPVDSKGLPISEADATEASPNRRPLTAEWIKRDIIKRTKVECLKKILFLSSFALPKLSYDGRSKFS